MEVVREGFLGGVMAAAAEKIVTVSEGKLRFHPETLPLVFTEPGGVIGFRNVLGFSFRCDFIFNLSVGSTPKIKILE